MALAISLALPARPSGACEYLTCPTDSPEVGFTPGNLTASFVSGSPGDAIRTAGNSRSVRTYSLATPCGFTDPRLGGCMPGDFTCPVFPDRVIVYFFVLR